MATPKVPRLVTSFCHFDERNCPELLINEEAEKSQQVIIRDDFGNEVLMSKDQMRGFIEKVRTGSVEV